jgi:hypothetical protein
MMVVKWVAWDLIDIYRESMVQKIQNMFSSLDILCWKEVKIYGFH